MTDGLGDYWPPPLTEGTPGTTAKRCVRHSWSRTQGQDGAVSCIRCPAIRDEAAARRGKNNRARGNREELTVARRVGGRKVGPLGLPWDVDMVGYARLQVRKLLNPPSLRAIAASLTFGTGEQMAGYVWVEPGRGGEQLIVFRLKDFAERHGIPEVDG
jgi:hypothetical protein